MKLKPNDQSIGKRFSVWVAEELHPETLGKSLGTGLLTFFLEVIFVTSFSALIFSGGLTRDLPEAIGLVLVGDAVVLASVALLSSYPGSIAVCQDAPSAILAVAAASVLATLPASATPGQRFSTVVVMVVGATLVTGLFFVLLGSLKLGGLARFLPYPVMGGFLAGTGWLLATGGIGVMANVPLGQDLFLPAELVRWLPGVVLGGLIMLAMGRFKGSLVLPGILVGTMAVFYLATGLANIPLDRLRSEGWLVDSIASGSLWRFPLSAEVLSQTNWSILPETLLDLVPIPFIAVLAVLLNVSGIELIVKKDIDPNRELIAAGLANLAAGLAGGVVGYHALSLSGLNYTLGASRRLPGLFAAFLLALTAFAGASLLGYVPKMILGALLFFLGLGFLFEWVYHAWLRFPRADFLIILLILGVIAARGFLEGIVVGLVLTIVVFVIGNSRTHVVKYSLSGKSFHSRVSRRRGEQQLLQAHGDELYILKLQGQVFFGTANRLFEQVRERLQRTDVAAARFVILDFGQVLGLDSTGLLSFHKMLQAARGTRATLVLTGANETIRCQFELDGLREEPGGLRFFSDLDRGVEWCENEIIAAAPSQPAPEEYLGEQLAGRLPRSAEVDRLVQHMERREVAAGEYLMRQGDEPSLIFFIESGQVTAQLEREGQAPLRLETSKGGVSVGEIGFYLGTRRSAAVVANEPTVVYTLSNRELEKLEQTEPEVASLLHRIVVNVLGERVAHLTSVVEALER